MSADLDYRVKKDGKWAVCGGGPPTSDVWQGTVRAKYRICGGRSGKSIQALARTCSVLINHNDKLRALVVELASALPGDLDKLKARAEDLTLDLVGEHLQALLEAGAAELIDEVPSTLEDDGW